MVLVGAVPRRMRLYLVVAAVLLLPIQACSPATSLPAGHPLNFTLVDFSIKGATTFAASGSFVINVHNASPVTHEFLIKKTDLPADSLPLGPDGVRVDEDALDSITEISDVPAGTTGTIAINLAPGNYVLFCNLEGHYLGGMHYSLDVTG